MLSSTSCSSAVVMINAMGNPEPFSIAQATINTIFRPAFDLPLQLRAPFRTKR
jgi:hypothetical protein